MDNPEWKPRRKKALTYLRVSTPKQVKREYDPEGISLPDQRRAVKAKADSIDADIMEEFPEKGVSARSVDKRPEFQRMLAYIKEHGDIDYVIVDSLSRANRNRIEDAMMIMALRNAGVEVVSATEPIDETPAGQLLHGILASVNEFRSTSDGNDVRRKMAYKASIGGTPGRAKIGYLNVGRSPKAATSPPLPSTKTARRWCGSRSSCTPPARTPSTPSLRYW